MKIYQVGTRDDFDEHQGYSYHTSKREAIKAWKNTSGEPQEEDFIEMVLLMNKKSILKFLNVHCSHPDNG